MPFFAGEIFVSEVFKKPVLDQTGEEIGRLKDIIVGLGEPFPAVTALVVRPARKPISSSWDIINLFNRRVISVNALSKNLDPVRRGLQRHPDLPRPSRQADRGHQRRQTGARQ